MLHRFFLVLSLSFITTSCTRTPAAQTELVMGTICSINLYKDGSGENYSKIFFRLKAIEEIFSANKEGTVLDVVNKNAGISAVPVPPAFIYVLQTALYFAQQSNGAFDPSIGPLVKIWNIGSGEERVPSEDEIKKTLPLINWRNIEIDTDAQTVFLKEPKMQLDLGGIVKGYAADEVVEIIKEAKIKKALVDLGGNIYVYGKKEGNWKIGVQNPKEGRGSYIGYVEIEGGTLVTSGIYERFFEREGKRYHHILSFSTGYPIENDLASVTITNKNAEHSDSTNNLHYRQQALSMNADALSTTVFSLGYASGCDLLSKFKNTSAVFIFKDGTVKTFGEVEIKQ